ncbi:Lipoyl(octanoyl) transferase LipB [Candidatus Hepatincolaceae symbiont of Richtersius coronifer]
MIRFNHNVNNFIVWHLETQPIAYYKAMPIMENHVELIIKGEANELIWLLEHFDIYTQGTSATPSEILNTNHNIPIIDTLRGGKSTYHGLGQRVIYPMLKIHDKDIKKYMANLQKWIVTALQSLDVDAFIIPDNIGVWVIEDQQEKKIAAIGVRVKKWVAYHGIAVNINSNLENFSNISPCGTSMGVTSLHKLKKTISFLEFDHQLKLAFYKVFNNE